MEVKYIAPNKWYHKLYNRYTLRQLKKQENLFTDTEQISTEKPIFVTGFFRSGTSLFTQLLQAMGVHLGPEKHLLQALHSRANLNPDGFFENYLFMETSLYAFDKLNSWGHKPPHDDAVKDLVFTLEDRKRFAEFSICGVRDDRITNKNKISALKNYDLLSLDTYLKNNFHFPYALKNPHFAVLNSYLEKRWPQCRYVVCFRQPMDSIASAAKITPELDEYIYVKYYETLLKLPPEKVCFVNYDDLMQNPIHLLTQLSQHLNLKNPAIEKASSLIKPQLHRFKTSKDPKTKELRDLYQTLKDKSIK